MKSLRLLFICFVFIAAVSAQQIDSVFSETDSLVVQSPDSLSLSANQNEQSDIDTVIYASASDSLIFFVKEKKMSLHGDAKINYRQTEVKSSNIYVDFNRYELDAEGKTNDSSGALSGTPVLTDGGEVYEGKTMRYNFKTGQGSLSAVNTELQGAYYHGEKIKKVSKDTYFIKNGKYTTCDKKDPDYYIFSPKMKVIQNDEIVAEWVFLFFGDVPLPVPVPFAVLPLQSGRRSGIIAPVFGSSGVYGTYFSRFGYFWAISDYMDWNIQADYYTRGSYSLYSRYRYAKRYNFTGRIEGSYKDFTQGESTDPDFNERIDWDLRWYHNQTITPSMRLDANLEFASSNFLQRGTVNPNDYLRNEIISNATLSKSWEESGISTTINYNRRQVIQTNDIYEVLPSISLSKTQSYPFRSGSSDSNRKWYELFGYSYSGQFQNNRNKVDGDLKIRGGIRHNLNFDFSPKLGFFTISPRFSYQEKWYNKQIETSFVKNDTGNDTLVTKDIHKIDFVRTFDAGLSASTKFFGFFTPPIPGISAIRHTVTPSLTYSYRPDFSEPFWGYYKQYTDTTGKVVKYDKFSREIFGGASSGEQQVLTFNIGNNFEMKTIPDPTDTTSKEEKIQLLNLSAGISYNIAADTLRFSDLRLSYRTQVSDFFDLSGSSSFTPYDYSGSTSRINKFLIDEGKGLLRLTSFNFSVTTRLSGERLKTTETGQNSSNIRDDEFGLKDDQNNVYKGIYPEGDPDFSIPWDISLSYNFNLNRPTPDNETKFSSLSGSLNFNLTPKWKFSVTGGYDFQNDKFTSPQVRISRDLHCWIMNFTWNPIGFYRGYRLEIRVKAPQLQDLKVTKQNEFFETR